MHTKPDSVDITEQEMVKILVGTKYTIFYTVSTAEKSTSRPVTVNIEVNNKNIKMELDTGAGLRVITNDTYNKIKFLPLPPAKTGLATFTGQPIPVSVTIKLKQRQQSLLLVVENKGPNLSGRNWIMSQQILEIQTNFVGGYDIKLNKLLAEYKHIFENTLGYLK